MTPAEPLLSVIVPAHNGTRVLPLCLDALEASDLPRSCWELIVVDDCSTDETAALATRYADVVVRLVGGPHGPAYARNRGVEAARGQVVVFVDADVVVHPDTLRRFAWLFANEPNLGAAFGSYDCNPPAPGLVSQYRNLLHHYHHQLHQGEAETFWAGCGAVRTGVFHAAGKFDEWHYRRPSIEDIELGHRIRGLGHRILLRPEIQCAHLKRWTLGNVLRTDLKDRGIPWMRLLLQEGKLGERRSLNIRMSERINTACVALAGLSVLVAGARLEPRWLLLTAALLAIVLVVNIPTYAFFARVRGAAFALEVVPLHLAYYLVNALAATTGWFLHHTVGEPSPGATVQAYAEVGVRTWPPVPAKTANGAWSRV